MTNSYILPNRALRLISEYSKPVTRPDWRNSKPIITTYELFSIYYIIFNNIDLQEIIIKNVYDTDWYDMYSTIKFCIIKNFIPVYY